MKLTTIQEGVDHVNNVVTALNQTKYNITNGGVTYETGKLIDSILATTKFRLNTIHSTLEPFQIQQFESRTKRELANPFHQVGKVAEWTFGLTSHEHFNRVQQSVEKNIKILKSADQHMSGAVKENSREIQESLQLLKQFEEFLKNIEKNDENLLGSDKLFLKLLRYKVDLDSSLDDLEKTVSMLAEIVDQSDLGLASRFMFSPDTLKKMLNNVDIKFPGLSPVFNSDKVDQYFSLPLSLSHINNDSLKSLIKIPLVDGDGVFEEADHDINQGLITLHSPLHRVIISWTQYKQCLLTHDKNIKQRTCLLRPCLINNKSPAGVKCIAINETSFLVSTADPILMTSSCSGSNKLLEISNFTRVQVPLQCQLNSKFFFIKSLSTIKEHFTLLLLHDFFTLISTINCQNLCDF